MKNGMIENDGDKEWYLNGKLHREDGPAIEQPNGDKYWFLNGKLHREDGPAIEQPNGDKEWYLNGKAIPFEFTSIQEVYDNHPEYLI